MKITNQFKSKLKTYFIKRLGAFEYRHGWMRIPTYGAHGAVRVPRDIHGRITVQIGVLERYLTVLNQVVNDVLRRYEATLTVRERDGMQVTDVAGGQPRALHRGYASGGVAALVAADEVEGQRRVVAGHLVTDFAVGNQTQLNERLEAVADAEH